MIFCGKAESWELIEQMIYSYCLHRAHVNMYVTDFPLVWIDRAGSETLQGLQLTPYSPTHPAGHTASAVPKMERGEDGENNNPTRPLRINVIPYDRIGGSIYSPQVVRFHTSCHVLYCWMVLKKCSV